jgi:lysophospholipase L1-like esterase
MVPRRALHAFATGVVVVALVLSAALAQASPAASVPTPTYLALGDSYAAGYGTTDWTPPRSTRLGYVAHFAGFVRGAAHGGIDTTVNLAVPGESTATFFAPGGQWAAAQAAIADPTMDVQVVTLTLGGNDLLYLLAPGQPCDPRAGDPSPACMLAVQTALQAFPTSYARVLTELTAALAAEDPAPERIIVTTYPNPFSGTPNAPFAQAVDLVLHGQDGAIDCAALADPRNTGLDDVLACVGRQFGATVADTYPAFEGKGSALTHIDDLDIHPTNAGYAQIATVVRAAWRR